MCSTGATSIILPAYITPTLSARYPTTLRSWEMKDHGEIEFALKRANKIQDLRLHRNIERRHGLIGDDQSRLGRQGAGDADRWRWPPLNSCG